MLTRPVPGVEADLISSEADRQNLGSLRVLIVHDWLVAWAGAERCLEQILRVFPQADLVVGVVGPSMRYRNDVTGRARETWMGRLPGARKYYQWFLPVEAAAFWSIDTEPYDLVISSSHALAKMVGQSRRGLHICYCHSPPRYVWDLYDTYMSVSNWRRRAALRLGRRFLQAVDKHSAANVTHFVANSNFVAQRIQRLYGRAARVVYPPVQRKSSASSAPARLREPFLLYVGRLAPYKRVDVIVKAAAFHGVRTVIAGDGPERPRLEALAGKNVEFLGGVSEVEAGRLLDTCAAFVFCAEEDFGIAPVEANAHGAPVVALRAGGVAETIKHGETGVLFDQPTPESLSRAVEKALARRWNERDLMANAERFSTCEFQQRIACIVGEALRGVNW